MQENKTNHVELNFDFSWLGLVLSWLLGQCRGGWLPLRSRSTRETASKLVAALLVVFHLVHMAQFAVYCTAKYKSMEVIIHGLMFHLQIQKTLLINLLWRFPKSRVSFSDYSCPLLIRFQIRCHFTLIFLTFISLNSHFNFFKIKNINFEVQTPLISYFRTSREFFKTEKIKFKNFNYEKSKFEIFKFKI